ncbi:MAG: hypothetical protein SFT93_01775 [Rickettsiaceae bacterium]|nr:hypothetical protein [Rickettsiaceae bacterium]
MIHSKLSNNSVSIDPDVGDGIGRGSGLNEAITYSGESAMATFAVTAVTTALLFPVIPFPATIALTSAGCAICYIAGGRHAISDDLREKCGNRGRELASQGKSASEISEECGRIGMHVGIKQGGFVGTAIGLIFSIFFSDIISALFGTKSLVSKTIEDTKDPESNLDLTGIVNTSDGEGHDLL